MMRNPAAGRYQGVADRYRLGRREAAQDRDQRHLLEVVSDHGSTSRLLEGLHSQRPVAAAILQSPATKAFGMVRTPDMLTSSRSGAP